MSEKNYENNFRLTLFQKEKKVYETIFLSDVFNPLVRSEVDIRVILPDIIKKLRKVLSKKEYDTEYVLQNHPKKSIDFYKSFFKEIKKYSRDVQNYYSERPEVVQFQVEDPNNGQITIRGVEFKLVLYRNDNLIVERTFYVDGYDSIALFSMDLYYTFMEAADTIVKYIKDADIDYIWENSSLLTYLYEKNKSSNGQKQSA